MVGNFGEVVNFNRLFLNQFISNLAAGSPRSLEEGWFSNEHTKGGTS